MQKVLYVIIVLLLIILGYSLYSNSTYIVNAGYVLAIVLGIFWIYIIWNILFSEKKRKVIIKEVSKPSDFLKERTLTLEDGSFGVKIEFLKQDLELEEMVELGQSVFSLKKFIEEARNRKEHQETSPIPQSQPRSENLSNELPDDVFFEDFNAVAVDTVVETTFDNYSEQEKFKLPDDNDFISFKI